MSSQVDALRAKLTRLDGLHREAKIREEEVSEKLKAELQGAKSTLSSELESKRNECKALIETTTANTARITKLERQIEMSVVSPWIICNI